MHLKDFNYLLFSLTRQVRTLVKTRIKNSPLTFEQLRALAHVSREEGITQTELSVLLEAKTMATSRIINALDQMNLLTREKASGDRRSYKLYLSSLGKQTMLDIQALSEEIYGVMCMGISDKDMQTCYDVLAKIKKNISTQQEFP